MLENPGTLSNTSESLLRQNLLAQRLIRQVAPEIIEKQSISPFAHAIAEG